LYKESLSELDSAWKQQLRAENHTAVRIITKRDPANYSDYTHPLLLNDSTIIADKSSMDDVERFVLIDRKTGREQILLTPGHHIGGTTSIGGDYLVWSELEQDARWSNRNYAEIRMYNFKTRKQHELTGESRYFAPIISPDGTQVAAVYVSEENLSCIDILEVPSGRLVRRYAIPGYGQAITPNWSPDAKRIIFTVLTERGETIAILDTTTGNIRKMLPETYNDFTGPAFFFSHYFIFSVDYSGIENVYAMDTLTQAIYQVSSGRFATYDPDFSSDKKSMICSDYTSDGLMIVEIQIDTATWLPIESVRDHSYKLYEALALQEMANIQDSVLARNIYKLNTSDSNGLEKDTIAGIIYPVKRYSKTLNLFNPHSWAPVSFDIDNLTFHPGVMLLSQNVLSTMFAGAGWEYDVNEETGKFYTTLSYRGWYPDLTFRFDIGNRAGYGHYQGSSETFRFTWQETNLSMTMGIPWNFSHGRYNRYVRPVIGTTLTNIRHNNSTPDQFTSGLIHTMDYRITASQNQRSNQKDVYPKFGQALDVAYKHTPFGDNDMGSIFGAEANLFFPGLFRHHGIWIYGGYQLRNDKDINSYSYSNFVAYPRGYTSATDEDLMSLKINYKLPLCYPDFSFGSVIYLKRLKLNLYYDWANGKNQGDINNYQSAGGELTADFHILRFVAPAEMGVRSVYYPSTGGWTFEFLYGIYY
jgi:hypothetical protein